MAYETFLSNLAPSVKGKHTTRDRREEARKAIETVTQASAVGSIANPDYIAAKGSLNRCVDQAVDHLRDTLFYPVIWAIENHEERFASPVMKFDQAVDPSGMYINLIPGRLKKAKTAPGNDTPYAKTLIALLTDILPLSVMMADLKGKVVKRQPKPVEERKPGYHPPKVNSEAERIVVALLESVTDQAYQQLITRIDDYAHKKLDEFMKAASGNTDRNFSPYSFFVSSKTNRYAQDHEGFNTVDKLVSAEGSGVGTWKPKPNAAKIIREEATRTADEYRMQFVYKNFHKIASIIDAKGNLESAKAVSHTVSLSGLEGTFVFTFKDGSSFVTVNSVVYATSHLGKHFARFPLRFHDVKLPDGVKMPRPNEERMNTVFLGKKA